VQQGKWGIAQFENHTQQLNRNNAVDYCEREKGSISEVKHNTGQELALIQANNY
jgi:hypothetical protein